MSVGVEGDRLNHLGHGLDAALEPVAAPLIVRLLDQNCVRTWKLPER